MEQQNIDISAYLQERLTLASQGVEIDPWAVARNLHDMAVQGFQQRDAQIAELKAQLETPDP